MNQRTFLEQLEAYNARLRRAIAEKKRAKQRQQELVHMNKGEVSTLDRILGRHRDIKGTPIHTYGNNNIAIPDFLKRKPKQRNIFDKIREMGRGGDTEMVSIPLSLAKLLDKTIHHGTKQINPKTGLREYHPRRLQNAQNQNEGGSQEESGQEDSEDIYHSFHGNDVDNDGNFSKRSGDSIPSFENEKSYAEGDFGADPIEKELPLKKTFVVNNAFSKLPKFEQNLLSPLNQMQIKKLKKTIDYPKIKFSKEKEPWIETIIDKEKIKPILFKQKGPSCLRNAEVSTQFLNNNYNFKNTKNDIKNFTENPKLGAENVALNEIRAKLNKIAQDLEKDLNQNEKNKLIKEFNELAREKEYIKNILSYDKEDLGLNNDVTLSKKIHSSKDKKFTEENDKDFKEILKENMRVLAQNKKFGFLNESHLKHDGQTDSHAYVLSGVRDVEKNALEKYRLRRYILEKIKNRPNYPYEKLSLLKDHKYNFLNFMPDSHQKIDDYLQDTFNKIEEKQLENEINFNKRKNEKFQPLLKLKTLDSAFKKEKNNFLTKRFLSKDQSIKIRRPDGTEAFTLNKIGLSRLKSIADTKNLKGKKEIRKHSF